MPRSEDEHWKIAIRLILNAKILVVDDKVANILLIEGILRVAGYTSVTSTLCECK